ncbi:hypothetical protein [Klebsiella pneumoniae]|uniref:hypothetical protein n=1 Tax=Klebsiella pneumoniae TaxID=573 RepID=UPI001BFEC58C|nr:hypothetical protein [Klebsiella pneumoniae]
MIIQDGVLYAIADEAMYFDEVTHAPIQSSARRGCSSLAAAVLTETRGRYRVEYPEPEKLSVKRMSWKNTSTFTSRPSLNRLTVSLTDLRPPARVATFSKVYPCLKNTGSSRDGHHTLFVPVSYRRPFRAGRFQSGRDRTGTGTEDH